MKTAQAIANYLEANQDFSPRTLEQYRPALARFEAEFPEMPQRPEPLRVALNRIDKVWVRDVHWRVWSTFLRWCEQEYDIPNPMHRVRRPKLPEIQMRVLEMLEMARVLAVAYKAADRAIVGLGLGSGIRASEFGRLRISDVGTNTIWVWGKGRKRLQVPITPETHHLLEPVIEQARKNGPDALLFTDEDGRPLSRFAVYRIVRGCMDRAGVVGNKRGPHCLRHSLGTSYIDAGGDPYSLKDIMRHKNITTTQKYVHYAMGRLVKKHHQYSPLKDALLAAQAGFFDTDLPILKEAERILKASRRDNGAACVGKTQTSTETQPTEESADARDMVTGKKVELSAHNNCEAKELVGATKASDGASKWVTPLLPGLDKL